MLTLLGPRVSGTHFCDRVPRRTFLQAGSLALGGAAALTLPNLLRAEQGQNSHKSIIMVYLSGGISHQDTFDLKPDAPQEVRGEFRPINTAVPGFQVCELLPRLAAVADKFSVVRSLVGLRDEHSSFHTVTGYPMGESQRDGRPSFGSVISRVQGSTDGITPPFVDLFPTMQHRPYNSPGPGVLGRAYAGVRADGEDLASMKLRYVTTGQLDQRRRLLRDLDQYRRGADTAAAAGMEGLYQRAFDVLTSSKLVDALDVTKEETAVREKYGHGSSTHLGDGAPLWNDQLLIARRLVEAGVRCVTVAYGFWDTHGNNFSHLKQHLPTFDQGLAALVEDLSLRGLDQDCTVVVWGEFGRTPKINKDAGRDHWARVNSVLLAGGGMRMGQVIGSTDKLGDSAATRPVHYQDVLATLYRTVGIDTHEMVRDEIDRPFPPLPESARPIAELF